MDKKLGQSFHTLNFVINNATSILLFAHTSPDGDTVGSVRALESYLESLGKKTTVACFDPFPEFSKFLSEKPFEHPDNLDLKSFSAIIACDSVDRGFSKIKDHFQENQVVAILDHHPDIKTQGDINIINPKYSSVCEIVYDFFTFNKIAITKPMADAILLGILSDTGTFQHANTTPRVLEITSDLIKKGASVKKVAHSAFNNKNISTLKLWGRALERAKINPENGMIVSALTQKDMQECQAGQEDIASVAGFLNAVPDTKFSLILSERENGMIKGSLRSEPYKNIDVSKIAATFGGGGHKLASGFEIKGQIKETEFGWEIV